MSRCHTHRADNTIEVRRRDDVPEQFLWRGRLYRVREILEHWTECGAWWEATARRSPPSSLVLAPIPASPKWAQRAWGEPAPDLGAATGGSLDDEEREFWRVEAGPGARSGCGVYDLCLDVSRGRWSLSAVLD